MAIAKTDIKLMEPKRLDDTDAGGGVITGNEILDGVVNNMFPNISRLDRTLGRVALAKGFVQINTADQEQYYGGHMIISEPQSDAGVNVMMVNLANDFDERFEAATRIGNPYSENPYISTVIDPIDPTPPTPYDYWVIPKDQSSGVTVNVTLPISQTVVDLTVGQYLYNSGDAYRVQDTTNLPVITLSGGPEFQDILVGDFFTDAGKSLEVIEISTGTQDSYYETTDFLMGFTVASGSTSYILKTAYAGATDEMLSKGLSASTILDIGGNVITQTGVVTQGFGSGAIGWCLYFTVDTTAGVVVGDTITPPTSSRLYEVLQISAGVGLYVRAKNFTVDVGDVLRVGNSVATVSAVTYDGYEDFGSNLSLHINVTTTALTSAVSTGTPITFNDLIPIGDIEFTTKLRSTVADLPAPTLLNSVLIDEAVNQIQAIAFVDYPSDTLARYAFTFGAVVTASTEDRTMGVLGTENGGTAGSGGEYVGGETLINFSGVTKLSVDGVLDDSTITVIDTTKELFPVGSEGLDPALVGLDSSNLPFDKKVNIIQANRVIVIHSTTEEAITNPAVASTTYPLTGTDYQLIELRDQAGVQVNPLLYTVDLVAGSVTMAGTIDLSPYTQPLVAHKRYEDMRLVTAVDHATKIVTLGRPLSQAFTAANTFVSSAVVFGDILSSYGSFFDQVTWTDVWQDTVIGSNAGGTYNDVAYPVQVTNAGCVTERWALEFTSSTAFNIIGENVGQIGTGVTNAAGGTFTEPLNPETGLPYFKLQQEGWGVGWSTGNVLRFNTIGCSKPVWFIRVTQQGDDTLALTDEFTVQIRGDVN